MKFEYLKFWLRWHWLPYKETTVCDTSYRWLCFELRLDGLHRAVADIHRHKVEYDLQDGGTGSAARR